MKIDTPFILAMLISRLKTSTVYIWAGVALLIGIFVPNMAGIASIVILVLVLPRILFSTK